jgi:hypothetical protein
MAASAIPANARAASESRTGGDVDLRSGRPFAPTWQAPGLLGVAAFAVYCATLAHGIGWDDSGELATGVLKLAPVHSAGYAPYVWLGHLFAAVVPFGSGATRVNLWSAFAGAVAVGLTARYLLVVSGSVGGAAVAALLLAAGPIVIYNATVASVYTFLALVVALLLNAADAWFRRPSPARLALLAFSIGLVGVAHVAGAPFAVGGLVLIAMRRPRLRLRELAPLAAILIPLAAVPLLARAGNSTGFPQVHVQASLWDLVSRSATSLADSLANKHGIAVHAWWLILTLVVSLSPAALVLAPAGIRRLWRERPYVVCCLVPAVVSSGVAVLQRGGYAYWHVPAVLAGAVACGAGVEAVRGALPRAALGAALLVCPVFGALYLAHSHREASSWSAATLDGLPPGARLVAPWIAYTPLRGRQVLDGIRRDVHLELTPTGAPVGLAAVGGPGYAVVVSASQPRAQPAGPAAGANFKGLSGLEAGPFKIGFDPVTARAYRLAR